MDPFVLLVMHYTLQAAAAEEREARAKADDDKARALARHHSALGNVLGNCT